MREMNIMTLVFALMILVQTPQFSSAQNVLASEQQSVMRYKTLRINGLDIFYREAGGADKPAILFLHGFPSSSHMYRDIMDDLSVKYRVIAPDYPGFGLSSAPSTDAYSYTFDNLSETIEQFINQLGLKKISIYMQDYGGPVGLRIAVRRPELIQSLIIQNANAYQEGLGDLKPFMDYIANQTPANEQTVRTFLKLDATKWQYTDGATDTSKISPDAYLMDQFFLDRAGNDKIQLSLFKDYGTNFQRYAEWHQYFRKYQPSTLILWGKNDKLFTAAGAMAYKKDLPKAEVHLIPGGHFLLEERHNECARLIHVFLERVIEESERGK